MKRIILTILGFVIPLSFSSYSYPQTIITPWSWDITSDYGPRSCPGCREWFHKAIDYGGPNESEIPAIEGGTIDSIGYGSGWYIKIVGNHGKWTYLHIFNGTGGQPVSAGNWELRRATLENTITGEPLAKVYLEN